MGNGEGGVDVRRDGKQPWRSSSVSETYTRRTPSLCALALAPSLESTTTSVHLSTCSGHGGVFSALVEVWCGAVPAVRMGVRYRVDEQDDLSVPVPVHKTGKDTEGRVKYAGVKLEQCLDIVTGTEEIEHRCPQCDGNVVAPKWLGTNAWLDRCTLLKTFPNMLVFHANLAGRGDGSSNGVGSVDTNTVATVVTMVQQWHQHHGGRDEVVARVWRYGSGGKWGYTIATHIGGGKEQWGKGGGNGSGERKWGCGVSW
ncbi:hypothetical protein K439DRAFT_1517778 [Ramaria rubella]|nr:hypothetical protein K439DRAFT_1517778 [Ramaria rubella]